MTEKEFGIILDEFTDGTGFDYHPAQKRWAWLAANKYHESELKILNKHFVSVPKGTVCHTQWCMVRNKDNSTCTVNDNDCEERQTAR